ncbi:MAG TPA: hypothetical protein VFE53_13195 [Mucilaginibacter sp.]|jgi:predicted transcriptional regulator|nr:hypothetical protein [Mucilaginibacter sp.]
MSTAEIKKTKANLIEWINQLTNSDTLFVLETLRNKSVSDWWNELSDAQKEHINEGLEDIKAGRVMISKEMWDSLNQP